MVTTEKDNRLANILRGIAVIILYFGVSQFKAVPLQLLNIDYAAWSELARNIYVFFVEIILISSIIFIFRKQYIKAWQDLKKNHREYFSKYIKVYLIAAIAMMVANSMISFLGGSMSGNETEIRNQFAQNPIYIYLSSVCLAPLLEESVFRLGFRNIFKNNILFVLVSSIIFGGLHLLSGFSLELVALYLIAYCSFGVAFSYMLIKTDNILVPTGFHIMHNGILMSLQFFLLIFS